MSQKSDLKIQNMTKFFIIALLKTKNTVTGYYILKRLKKDLGKNASPTYVYDFLKSLANKGYIEHVQSSGSKKSKGYKLTPTGQEFAESIFLKFSNIIDAAIQTKLKVCYSCGVKLYDNYYTETIDGERRNFCCVHCASAYKSMHGK